MRCGRLRIQLCGPILVGILYATALDSSASVANPWRTYQRHVKTQVRDIGDRLDASVLPAVPSLDGAPDSADAYKPFPYEALCEAVENPKIPAAANVLESFGATLRNWNCAVIRLPRGSDDLMHVNQLRSHADRFYGAPKPSEYTGALRALVEDGTLMVGHMAIDNNEFVDIRRCSVNSETQYNCFEPRTLVDLHPDLSRDLNDGWETLIGISATAVKASALSLHREPESFLGLMDRGDEVEPSSLSHTVQRFCRYGSEGKRIAFGSHTDSTFFTVIPVASSVLQPGVQVFSQGQWLCPETNCDAETDVLIMTGEFLQVLSHGVYPAAVHRVARPRHGSRVSTPMLVRGKPSAVLERHVPTGLYPANVKASDLHQLLLRLFKEDCEDRDLKKNG